MGGRRNNFTLDFEFINIFASLIQVHSNHITLTVCILQIMVQIIGIGLHVEIRYSGICFLNAQHTLAIKSYIPHDSVQKSHYCSLCSLASLDCWSLHSNL